MDDWGSIPGKGNNENFSLCHCVQTGCGANPASYPMDTRALALGVKWHETDHSPPSGAQVKNLCSYTSSPLCVFTA